MNEARALWNETKFIVAIFEGEKLQLRLQRRKCSLDFLFLFDQANRKEKLNALQGWSRKKKEALIQFKFHELPGLSMSKKKWALRPAKAPCSEQPDS